jgi:hypothetical protein
MLKDILNYDAAKLLSIDSPEALFTIEHYTLEAKRLLIKWHPDKSSDPQASIVAARINTLFDQAKIKAANGTWKEPGVFRFTNSGGKSYKVRYRQSKALPIGEMVYGKTIVAYSIGKDNADLNSALKTALSTIKTAASINTEFLRFIPQVKTLIETDTGTVVTFDKTDDVIPLADLLKLSGGVLDPKHVAWIGNRLHNLVCFLEYKNLTYNAFTLDNVWVSPQYHSALLIGGWWYSKPIGAKVVAVPSELLNILPKQLQSDKVAYCKYDLIAIKSILLKLLGDPTGPGMGLLKSTTVPELMLKQLRSPVVGNAVAEYKKWENTVDACFGKRKFIKLNVNIQSLYED